MLYTVTLINRDPQRAKQGVTLVDTPSPWLRLQPNSIRFNGKAAPELVAIASDGKSLSIAVPDIAAGAKAQVTYAMVVRANAPAGTAVNRAEATDPRGGQSVAQAVIHIDRNTIASRMTIIGRVTVGSCDMIVDRPGLPGVRVMLEDGSFAITDYEGRYHFEGILPGTHIAQAQRQTLPEGGSFVDCDRSARTAGSAISRFVIGQGGSLAVADFTADVPDWSPAHIGSDTGNSTLNEQHTSQTSEGVSTLVEIRSSRVGQQHRLACIGRRPHRIPVSSSGS